MTELRSLRELLDDSGRGRAVTKKLNRAGHEHRWTLKDKNHD
jgi:hypothetical protein